MESLSTHLNYLSKSVNDFSNSAIPYVGYPANENLGDVELFNLFRKYSGLQNFGFLAHKRGPYAKLALKRTKHSLVGGGTLMFTEDALKELWFQYNKGIQPIFLGTGVPDNYPEQEKLERWKQILKSSDEVWVRGPHSQKMLDDIGIGNQILGDLGYLLSLEREEPAVLQDYAVIVLRAIRPTEYNLFSLDFGTRELQLGLANKLKSQGIEVKVLAVSIDDFPTTRSMMRTHFKGFDYHEYHGDFKAISDLLAGARVVSSMRLHPGIFALANGTRVIELEGRAKFHDSFNVFPNDGNFYNVLDPRELSIEQLHFSFMEAWDNETNAKRFDRLKTVQAFAQKQKEFCVRIGNKIKG